MNLVQDARTLLTAVSFSTSMSIDDPDVLYFESDQLLGFLWQAASVAFLLSHWEKQQDLFLVKNARRLRAGAGKTWNICGVLLTTEVPEELDRVKLIEIEEDFRAARKIARAGLTSMPDLQDALLPLLPLQNLGPVLSDQDNDTIIREKLSDLPARAIDALLSPDNVDQRLARFKAAYENQKS